MHTYDHGIAPGVHVDAGAQASHWRASELTVPPTASFDEVMSSDAALLELLLQIKRFGFTIVQGVPTAERGVVTTLAKRVAFLRDSNFGLLWDVRSAPKPDSLAYTSVKLYAHTDLVARETPPGMQFLHCRVNDASGGASTMVDGFAVADELRRSHPEHFATLTSTPCAFRYQSDDTDVSASSPMIRLDAHGAYVELRYSSALMSPLQCPPDRIRPYYEAYQAITRLLRDPVFEHVFRLAPGDCEVFDNRRVLHGRSEFDPNSGPRHLEGCYVDTDDWLSRLRVLQRTRDFRER